VFAFNVEAFVSKVALSYMTKILISNKPFLVVDESSRIKSPSAKRTKEITKFSKYAKYKRILTGTPITKGPQDVYSQFKFLDPNILGYDSYYSFRSRYCIMGGYENRQTQPGFCPKCGAENQESRSRVCDVLAFKRLNRRAF
jgi:SNF2 family DNA or RNA helicase